jgi:hypothetical protein
MASRTSKIPKNKGTPKAIKIAESAEQANVERLSDRSSASHIGSFSPICMRVAQLTQSAAWQAM